MSGGGHWIIKSGVEKSGNQGTEMYLLPQDWIDHQRIKFAKKIEIRNKPCAIQH